MDDEARIIQVLEHLLDSNSTPDDACASCPELLPRVRDRWRQLQGVQEQIDVVFPSPVIPPGAKKIWPPHLRRAFPTIPGYRIDSILGKGGMGIVYKAHHAKLNRYVALKMLLSGSFASEIERKRFAREAKAIAGLKHPNLVQIYGIGKFEGCPFFTMELAEGGTLAQMLGGISQPPLTASAMVATLATAVQVAHDGLIIHRDLKPSNVLIGADGQPKISDFGLARLFEDEADITRSGARVGTPCYMAPEQVLNRSGTVGPPADIYSLGTILYEMLTGRPPFLAGTAAAAEMQLISDDPVPPSRLNRKVPRDLETICLKCLQKDPNRRYVSAKALAEDLGRFSDGEPVKARPVNIISRTAKWVHRRPAQAALLVSGIVLAAVLTGGTFWYLSARSSALRSVSLNLSDVGHSEEQGDWNNASLALMRARDELGNYKSLALEQQIRTAGRDLDLVKRLDAIHVESFTFTGAVDDLASFGKVYERAFKDAGIGGYESEPDVVAAGIRRSPIHAALVAALNAWVLCASASNQLWILRVAKLSDPDPLGFRDHAREPNIWRNRKLLSKMIETIPVTREPASFLMSIASHVRPLDDRGISFLVQVQNANPGDFWINLLLGDAMNAKSKVSEAVGYFRAALATRPKSTIVRNHLGYIFLQTREYDQAIDQFTQEIQADSTAAVAYGNRGVALYDARRFSEATDDFREAAQMLPGDSRYQLFFGKLLRQNGSFKDAFEHIQIAKRLKPSSEDAREEYHAVVLSLGRVDLLQECWDTELKESPPSPATWEQYSKYCAFSGRMKDFENARTFMLATFHDTRDPHIAERIGRACLIRPGAKEQIQQASDLIDRAIAGESKVGTWAPQYFEVSHGLAQYRRGDFEGALQTVHNGGPNVLLPLPQLVAAMAFYREGQVDNAHAMLAKAAMYFDWTTKRLDFDGCMYNALRQEAEAMIYPDLSTVWAGKAPPQDESESACLLADYELKGMRLASARWYLQVFTNDPHRAEIPDYNYRYRAACSAAMAGCGRSADSANLSPTDQLKWRAQSLEWLQAELAAWDQRKNKASNSSTALTDELRRWRTDDDLEGVRDATALEKMNGPEKAQWTALWSAVNDRITGSPTTSALQSALTSPHVAFASTSRHGETSD